MLGNPLLLSDDGYNISRSVRLRSSASAYFNRTLTTPTNNKIWTWSGWLKRGTLPASTVGLFGAGTSGTNYCYIGFTSAQVLNFQNNASSGNQINASTSAVFRDPSAWYHIVLSVDTTQATNSNGVKIWVNGVQQTLTFSTYTQNTNTLINAASGVHVQGDYISGGGLYFDGYLTEVNFIDGQALTPSSFGETDSITGVWKPKKYAGTYGTNGFYLNFSDNSNNTAATIGKDYSGNGNNWTPNNISVTSGATYDSMLDVPTPYADGGNGRGNYAVVNPLKKSSSATITDGNLTITWGVLGGEQPASFAQSSGKWYWEQTQSGSSAASGIILDTATPSASSISQGYHYYGNGQFYTGTSGVAYGATFTSGDVIGVALDLDANQITFYKNGTSQGAKTIAAGSYNPDFAAGTTITINANFGQRPFAYTPPTGFKALNTQNLPDSTIKKGNLWFDATTYTGTGSTQSIVNSGAMQPDLVWIKDRSSAASSNLLDSVRGPRIHLESNTTNAETTESAGVGLTSFNSNGFTLGTDNAGAGRVNYNGDTFVGWQWKESATAGFDIVTFTAASSGNFTVNHSLGVTPAMLIVKTRDSAGWNWHVWHKSLSSATNSVLVLNSTAAVNSSFNMWGASGATSTNFGVTAGNPVAANSACVAYLFAEVAGFSKFGSYTGNGSADGPFVFCGFRPRWIMFKRTDSTQNWAIIDTSRDTHNVSNKRVFANLSDAEDTGIPNFVDVTANGFKCRDSNVSYNASGGTYIFAAFAENPFKNSLAR